jgi:hypothetical protein
MESFTLTNSSLHQRLALETPLVSSMISSQLDDKLDVPTLLE